MLILVPFPRSQIFLVILNVLIMSPLQRLKRRVGRYFKRSEYMIIFYNHKPVLLTFFFALFQLLQFALSNILPTKPRHHFFHHHFICSVKCKNTVEKKTRIILNKANQAHTSAYGSLYIGLYVHTV